MLSLLILCGMARMVAVYHSLWRHWNLDNGHRLGHPRQYALMVWPLQTRSPFARHLAAFLLFELNLLLKTGVVQFLEIWARLGYSHALNASTPWDLGPHPQAQAALLPQTQIPSGQNCQPLATLQAC